LESNLRAVLHRDRDKTRMEAAQSHETVLAQMVEAMRNMQGITYALETFARPLCELCLRVSAALLRCCLAARVS
jgi:hypothetical protein